MQLKKLVLSTLVMVTLGTLCQAQSEQASIDSCIESVRADLRANKVAIITDAMKFNDSDAKIFWPIYRKYEADVTKVNDIRVDSLKMYDAEYDTMTDADAKTLIDKMLSYQTQRVDLKKKYAKEFQKGGLSLLTVAKFLQLEHRLDLEADIVIAASFPALVEKQK
jgi:hypothetical protein